MRLLSIRTFTKNCHFVAVKQRMMGQSLPCGEDLKTSIEKKSAQILGCDIFFYQKLIM